MFFLVAVPVYDLGRLIGLYCTLLRQGTLQWRWQTCLLQWRLHLLMCSKRNFTERFRKDCQSVNNCAFPCCMGPCSFDADCALDWGKAATGDAEKCATGSKPQRPRHRNPQPDPRSQSLAISPCKLGDCDVGEVCQQGRCTTGITTKPSASGHVRPWIHMYDDRITTATWFSRRAAGSDRPCPPAAVNIDGTSDAAPAQPNSAVPPPVSRCSCPPVSVIKELLNSVQRVTFYGFLVALSKDAAVNGSIGEKPSILIYYIVHTIHAC